MIDFDAALDQVPLLFMAAESYFLNKHGIYIQDKIFNIQVCTFNIQDMK